MRVQVVSVMGLHYSGQALAALRFRDAFAGAGARVECSVVAERDMPEHGEATQFRDLEALSSSLFEHTEAGDLVFWAGLHTDEDLFMAQLSLMEQLAARDVRNSVVLERTELPDLASLSSLLAMERSTFSSFSCFNMAELDRWRPHVGGIPLVRFPPPIPESFFRIAPSRQPSSASGGRFQVLVPGRISLRKGTDLVLEVWSSLSQSLRDLGCDPHLVMIGRNFDGDQPLVRRLSAMCCEEGSSVEWIPTPKSGNLLDDMAMSDVGLCLSRQDFDGIAVTEMMASGLPVVMSRTSGQRAIAEESDALVGVSDVAEASRAVTELASSAELRCLRGLSGSRDMRTSRSEEAGREVASHLLNLALGFADGSQP